jgi:uncharacterized delta-60 repeat protein
MKIVLISFAFVFVTLAAVLAFGAAGDPDPDFGSGGFVLASFSSESDVVAWDALIQSTGKIVVAGHFSDAAGDQIALARFDSSGELDLTFGTGGWTIINFGMSSIFALAAAEQSDGKIVVTGELDDGTTEQFYVARFSADGQVDPKFGKAGITVIDFGFDSASLDVAIAPDSGILIAGIAQRSDGNANFALVRVDQKGKLDKSFGNKGIVETDFNGFLDFGTAVAIQPDGKIVVGGSVRTAEAYGAMGVARYMPTGSLDPTFGTGGKVTTDFGTADDDFINEITIDPDFRILVGGTAQPGSAVFTIVRYNPNGTINVTHTEDYIGSVFDSAVGLALAPNERIILGGQVQPDFGSETASTAVSCYDADANLDLNFGVSGWVVTDTGSGFDGFSKVRLQSDDKIVAVGSSVQGDGRSYLVLARFIGCG